jgi:hypothetical protein
VSLVKNNEYVHRVITGNGWVFKVIPGTFATEVTTEGGKETVWFTFQAYGKTRGSTEHIAIRQSEVSRIMEAGEAL